MHKFAIAQKVFYVICVIRHNFVLVNIVKFVDDDDEFQSLFLSAAFLDTLSLPPSADSHQCSPHVSEYIDIFIIENCFLRVEDNL